MVTSWNLQSIANHRDDLYHLDHLHSSILHPCQIAIAWVEYWAWSEVVLHSEIPRFIPSRAIR